MGRRKERMRGPLMTPEMTLPSTLGRAAGACRRDLEHHKNYRNGHEDSHMLKHWVGTHRDQPRPTFNQFVVMSYKTRWDRKRQIDGSHFMYLMI